MTSPAAGWNGCLRRPFRGEQFRSGHPTAEVLNRDTGSPRPYGRNPYGAYDQRDAPLTGFFSGDVDAREAAMERVVGVTAAEPVAVRSAQLAEVGVIETTVAGTPLTLWSAPGLASSLNDDTVAGGDHIGASGVFVAEHGGRTLSFTRDGHQFVDAQTGSTWNILGEAVAGPLAGATLGGVPRRQLLVRVVDLPAGDHPRRVSTLPLAEACGSA